MLKLIFPAFPNSYSLDSLVSSPLLALHLASAQLCCVFEHQEWKLFRFPLRILPHQQAALGRWACLQLQDMHIDQSFPFVTLHPAIDFNSTLVRRKHSVHVQLPVTKFLLSTPFARWCLRSALQSCGSLSLLASSNLHKSCSSQFVSIKSISDSLWQLSLLHDFTLQWFVSEVPCVFFVFFFFFKGVVVIIHFVCRYLIHVFPDPLSCCCP